MDYSDLEVLKVKHNKGNGFAVVYSDVGIADRIVMHYSCDPGKDPQTEAGKAWIAETGRGMGRQKWNQEYEGDPFATVGKSIHPDFRREIHVRKIEPIPHERMYVGIDPAIRLSGVAWLQIRNMGSKTPQVRVYRELRSLDKDMAKVGQAILDINKRHFDQFEGKIYYEQDIAGQQREQATGISVQKILGMLGIAPASQKSRPEDRIQLINHLLSSTTDEGEPCFLIDPCCTWAIGGLSGLYRRRENSTRIDPTEATHIMDAIQYPVWNFLHLPFMRGKFKSRDRHPHAIKNLRELLVRRDSHRTPDSMEA